MGLCSRVKMKYNLKIQFSFNFIFNAHVRENIRWPPHFFV
jgi:hypothetical protein